MDELKDERCAGIEVLPEKLAKSCESDALFVGVGGEGESLGEDQVSVDAGGLL